MKSRSIEAVGWIFWVVTFVLFIGPLVYGMWLVKPKSTSWLVPVGAGVVIAAFAAAIVSWVVNSALQYWQKKRRIAGRKKARKRG